MIINKPTVRPVPSKYTPIWKLEVSLKCRSCRKGRYAPPVRMITLTEVRSITPYKWAHPDEERVRPKTDRWFRPAR
jgi:hypothetical protein